MRCMRTAGLLVLLSVAPVAGQQREFSEVVTVMREHALSLMAAQEIHYSVRHTYAGQVAELFALQVGGTPALGVLRGYGYELLSAGPRGWSGRVTNPWYDGWQCVLYVGTVEVRPRTARGMEAAAAGVTACDTPPDAAELARMSLRRDLRMQSTYQERYHRQSGGYARDLAALPGYAVSPGVTLRLDLVSGDGWSARAQHIDWASGDCVYHLGSVPALRTRGGAEGKPGQAVCDAR